MSKVKGIKGLKVEDIAEHLLHSLQTPDLSKVGGATTVSFENCLDIVTREHVIECDINNLQGQMDLIKPIAKHYVDNSLIDDLDESTFMYLQQVIGSLIAISLKVGSTYGVALGIDIVNNGNTVLSGKHSESDLSKFGAQWYGAKKNESTRSSAISWAVKQLEENPGLSNNRLAAIIVAESTDPDKFGRTVKFGTARDYARAARKEKESSNST